MRILLLGPYPPPHGGVQTHLTTLREYLLRQGVPTAVINITRYRKQEAEEVYYPHNAIALLVLLLRLRYDVIHLHFGGDLTVRLLALTLACVAMRVPTVMTFHSGGYPSSNAGQAAHPLTLRGYVLRLLHCVIGVNQSLVTTFHRFGLPPDRVRMIPPHALSGPSTAQEWPERLTSFYADHHPLLLTVSGLEPEYDIPLQIEMLGKLRQTMPSAGLVILGWGSMERELRTRIDAKIYSEHILMFGDVSHELALEAISRSDIMLRTTWYDGDAISVREALHLGTPVIATDNGMRPAGVVLIANPTPESLSAAIERCISSGSRVRVRESSSDENLKAILDLYVELHQRRMGVERAGALPSE